MNAPAPQSLLRNRAAIAEELRRLLPQAEGFRATRVFPFGVAAIDRCLPHGGLAGGGLHEIVPDHGATPAAFGFAVALLAALASPREPPARPLPPGQQKKIFLVMPGYGRRDYGRPYGHGLGALGLDPGRLILAETTHRRDTLWAIEETLHSGVPAAIAAVIDKLDLKSSQRLQLAAHDAGLPLFLLRPADLLESSAAATRWRVGTVPAARDRFGLIVRARWQLMLERCRNGRAGEWMVEYDHVAHRFSLAAAMADPAFSHRSGEKSLRQAH